RLARHAHEGGEIFGRCPGDAPRADTAVAVSIQDSAFVIDRDFVEVEQVAVLVAAPLLPDAGHALDGIVRRGVDRDPGPAPVIGRGDERVPDPRETVRLVVAGHVGADEAAGGAARAAADRLGVHGVLDSVRRADVEIIDPGQAAVLADLDVDMPFGRIAGRHRLVVDVAVIGRAVVVDRHGGIGALGLGCAPSVANDNDSTAYYCYV